MKRVTRSQPVLTAALGALVTLVVAFPVMAVEPQLDAYQPTVYVNSDDGAEPAKASYQSSVYIVQLNDRHRQPGPSSGTDAGQQSL